MKNKKFDEQFYRKLKIMELNKTPERKKFEEEYSCYIFILRPNSDFSPENDKINWSIDSWYKVEKTKYEELPHIISMMKLRARFNMAHTYAIWLPNIFNDKETNKIEEPEIYYDLIFKYKFKI